MTLNASDVTACIVTRGNLDLQPILDTLLFPYVIVYDNSKNTDVHTAGRYLAIQQAKTAVVFCQDDDVIVTPEQQQTLLDHYHPGWIVANQADGHQPPDFEPLTFLGWGSVFDRDLPTAAHTRWRDAGHSVSDLGYLMVGCDIAFQLLTPTLRLDLGQNHRPEAFGPDRAYRDARFQGWKWDAYEKAMALR